MCTATTTPSDCPDCTNNCIDFICECTDLKGNVLTPPSVPFKPKRPPGCPPCDFICPSMELICGSQGVQCTDAQLENYVRLCLDCIRFAGCKQPGCDCKDCQGNLFTPPTNPPQPPRDEECANCTTTCPKNLLRCKSPVLCSSEQLKTYVPVCPDCIPQAGCQHIGCECTDCSGYILIPPSNPPQPPRPNGCPKCNTTCIKSRLVCPAPIPCNSEQLKTYVFKEPQYILEYGCC